MTPVSYITVSLAGLVAICAGSDVVHPVGALIIGAIAGVIFVKLFTYTQNKLKVDDVLGVWPLHGVCGAFGGIAVGIIWTKMVGRFRRYFNDLSMYRYAARDL